MIDSNSAREPVSLFLRLLEPAYSLSSNIQILAYEDTELGPLCLRRRELLSMPGTVVTEVTLNHEFLMSSFNTDSERALSNRAVEIHGGKDLRILVGGLGLGYTTFELLKHQDSVGSVEVVELLPPVIDWLRTGLLPLSTELNAGSRLQISQGDVYGRLLSPPGEHFALVVIDVDHSPADQLGAVEHPFYTKEGLISAKSHLKENGVLAVWSYAESSDFSHALRYAFEHVHVESVTTFNALVDHEQTDWLFFGHG